ncbi:MAG TPA: CAP domain-containing protein [Steroidobacteraceae bacterium]|nr:CAP domain-containing protein [Steroidobacteraceae bacterium]
MIRTAPTTLILWLLACCAGPALADTPALARPAEVQQRVLDLVNRVRAQGRTCGRDLFPPAHPLVLSRPLQAAATAHARDMARRSYFEHRAPDGSEPKDRVRRAGYRPRLTGENIAFGPESAEEVVAGWLASPGHCANLMDLRFREMGVAVAQGRRRGHFYWVQNLGAPAR